MRTVIGRLALLSVLAALTPGCGDDSAEETADKARVTCEGSSLEVPDDPAARGPWPVGAKTVTLAGLRTEIWYPAEVGSDAGKEKVRYDLREHLPEGDQDKISDEDNPWQPCDCTRDLPLDAAHGPYPVVVFLHGMASFRTQNAAQATHWASRGFVVAASDYPQLELRYALEFKLGDDQPGDAERVLDALESPAGEVAFLAGHIDTSREALVGYSAGGRAIKRFGDRPGVRVLIPMAAGGVFPGDALLSTLLLGTKDDVVSRYDEQLSGYEDSPPKKRLVGLATAGHLAFTDLCSIGRERGGLLKISVDSGVKLNPLILQLTQDSCRDDQLPPELSAEITSYATAAALEETLACRASSAAKLAGIREVYPEVVEYKEAL